MSVKLAATRRVAGRALNKVMRDVPPYAPSWLHVLSLMLRSPLLRAGGRGGGRFDGGRGGRGGGRSGGRDFKPKMRIDAGADGTGANKKIKFDE